MLGRYMATKDVECIDGVCSERDVNPLKVMTERDVNPLGSRLKQEVVGSQR